MRTQLIARVTLPFVAVAMALAVAGGSAAYAQSSPAAEAALAPMRRDAEAKAAAAKATAATLTPAQRDDALQLFSTGFTLAEQQDWASAKTAFQRGLAIDPSSGQAEYYLAEVLMQQNDLAHAMPHFALAHALAPDAPEGFKANAALAEGQTTLSMSAPVVPIQAGQVWTLSWTNLTIPYEGSLRISSAVDATHFRGTIQVNFGIANHFVVNEDAVITLNGNSMTITCANATILQGPGGFYGPDVFQLSRFGSQWTGLNQRPEHAATDVVLTKS